MDSKASTSILLGIRRCGMDGTISWTYSWFYMSLHVHAMVYPDNTNDKMILDRLNYIVNELPLVKKAHGDGYLLATVNAAV